MLPMRRGIAAVDAGAQVHDAVGAERHDGLAGLRVQLLQQAVHREDQALVAAVGALPVVHAAAGHAGHVLADPQLPAGRGVHGHERSVAAAAVDHAAHDDRAAARLAERIGPGHLQPGDVAACRSAATRNSGGCRRRCRIRSTTCPPDDCATAGGDRGDAGRDASAAAPPCRQRPAFVVWIMRLLTLLECA